MTESIDELTALRRIAKLAFDVLRSQNPLYFSEEENKLWKALNDASHISNFLALEEK